MNHMNEILREALGCATGALFVLNDQGCTACSIDIRGGRPMIRIDRPPNRLWHGATLKSHPVPGGREFVKVAIVQGCQVEWTEQLPANAMRADA